MNIVCHIEQLLRSHDCVTVPGFGAFVAAAAHASHDAASSKISPPSRTVMFNPELTHNDGLLASSVARRDGLSYERAMERIADEVALTHAMLRTTGVMKFGSLGKFRLTHDFLDFLPASADSSSANPWSLLEPLDLLTIEESKEEEPAVILASPDKYYVPVSRNIFRVAASIAVMVALGFMLFTLPVNVDTEAVMASVIGKIMPAEKAAGQDATDVITVADGDSLFDYPDDTTPADLELAVMLPEPGAGYQSAESVNEPKAAPERTYRIIVASLASYAQAEKYVASADDSRLRIHDTGEGKFRVYVDVAPTLDEALKIAESDEIKSVYPSAWVSRL